MNYIVCDDESPLQLGHYDDTPKSGILLHGEWASVFKSYSSAKCAINRTNRYAESKGFNWSRNHKIMRLVNAGS